MARLRAWSANAIAVPGVVIHPAEQSERPGDAVAALGELVQSQALLAVPDRLFVIPQTPVDEPEAAHRIRLALRVVRPSKELQGLPPQFESPVEAPGLVVVKAWLVRLPAIPLP